MTSHYVFTFEDQCDYLSWMIIASVKDGFDTLDSILESDWYKKGIIRIATRFDTTTDRVDEEVRNFLKASQWIDTSEMK